jgi:hypothetical protein
MNNSESIPLTSSELGYLWTGYAINEMSKWFLILFREHAKDAEIKDVYNFALETANEILSTRQKMLTTDCCPIPVGFSEKDINIGAPAIFSDQFLLFYLYKASQLGLLFHTRSLALATRNDIRNYHTKCLQSTILLIDKTIELMKKQGLLWRTPHLATPTYPEKIQKTSYLSGWFGDTRQLNSLEIANLYHILEILIMIKTICKGFSQTAKSDEIRDLIKKGMQVIEDHYQNIVEILNKSELPIPPSYKGETTDSTENTFSDHIMLCHLAGMFGSLLSEYGFSLGAAMKHDLVNTFTMLIAKGGLFSEKATKVLIKKEWLEKVPGAEKKNK